MVNITNSGFTCRPLIRRTLLGRRTKPMGCLWGKLPDFTGSDPAACRNTRHGWVAAYCLEWHTWRSHIEPACWNCLDTHHLKVVKITSRELSVDPANGAFIIRNIMMRIELCLYGFEPSTERSIQVASAEGRVTPRLGDARAGNARESDSVGIGMRFHTWSPVWVSRV